MKIFSTMLMCLTFTACTTTATHTKNAQNFINELQSKRDAVSVVESYKNDYSACKDPGNTTWWSIGMIGKTIAGSVVTVVSSAGIGIFALPFLYAWLDKSIGQCIKQRELAEPGTNFLCLKSYDKDNTYYSSDECIIYRRNIHKSDVNYFDYKRLLGEDSTIKTDADFLKLVAYYDTIKECDSLIEATSDEKENCRENIKNNIRTMAYKKVNCKTMFNEKYTNFLQERGEWYEWAIDHDPYERVRMLWAGGAYTAANFAYAPVYSRSEALDAVANRIRDFGDENLCETDGWKAEMRKMGFGI